MIHSYPSIMAPVADAMVALDDVIHERLQTSVPLVEQVSQYIIQGGGKRIRPVLVLLAAGATHDIAASLKHTPPLLPASPATLELAAIVEFIHTATLLHDDVVDESSLRRNRATANAVFGNAASVLVGDFLYSRAFQMMVGLDSLPVMGVLAEATNVIAEGEVLQLMNCQDPDVEEARYLQVIRFKTAKLFEASARLPAVYRGLHPEIIAGLGCYGRHLGTAFQLVDDILDFAGSEGEMGKQLGDDLREGKPTLPIITLLSRGTPQTRERVAKAIVQPDQADIEAILSEVRSSGVLDYATEVARAEVDLAVSGLDALPSSPFKTSLLDLASFVLERHS